MTEAEMLRMRRKLRFQLVTAARSVVSGGLTLEEATDEPMPIAVRDDEKAAFIELLRAFIEDGHRYLEDKFAAEEPQEVQDAIAKKKVQDDDTI